MAGLQEDEQGREVMIVAGEASGDLHGARLVQALQALDPCLRFCGMGGQELRAAGVELLADAAKLAVVGAVEVLSHLGDILRARRALIERMRARRPALLILIDYPDFNFLLARKAKQLGIPIFYYISPQLWAWRSGRIRTIKRLVDRMAVILPFEPSFYARHGVQVDFVGHPLLDSVKPGLSPDAFKSQHAIEPNRTLVGLLPGSRRKEIAALLPVFLDAAGLVARDLPRVTFLLPQAPTINRDLLDQYGLAAWQERLDIRVVSEGRYAMMAACDAAMAASGTVVLELGILGVPTVAAYRMSPHTYWLGRLLIRGVRFFSLINLIADREVIPELLQNAANPEQIARATLTMLQDEEKRQATLAGLAEVRRRLGGPGASQRAAAAALDLLDVRRKSRG
ncbi:MAG: lipid-A-disaccharide synthase [Desulfobulbus sp.]|nr:lipid-A-disaccharide synthase [Desulfobulbus sp.]